MAKIFCVLVVGFALLFGGATSALANEELVLIVSSDSAVERLDSAVVRKLFLGLTVTEHGMRLRPVLNEADARIRDLFLQNVVSMSDSTYDRYVLRMALLQGKTQPLTYNRSSDLIGAVAADPSMVGYVWAKDITHDPRVRVLRVLWHD